MPPRKLDPLAAVLSYLIPGLGQVVQGRIGKGLLYFVCLYSLFFYGMALGHWRNVWLADSHKLQDLRLPILDVTLPGFAKDVMYRKEFAGQFWMGVVVWPAILQYQMTEAVDEKQDHLDPDRRVRPQPNPMLGHYMQAPIEADLNDLQRNGDKRWDLGWVYTVIAGVLNILVIYDALAGPVVRDEDEEAEKAKSSGTPVGGAA